MKKVLFTLIALLTVSSALADCYLYTEGFTLRDDQYGQRISIPVHASFDARVGSFTADINLPKGLTMANVNEGEDMLVTYRDATGAEQTDLPWLEVTETEGSDYSIVHIEAEPSENAAQGHWIPEGGNSYEPYGLVKWEAGNYDEFLVLEVVVSGPYLNPFAGGEVAFTMIPVSDNDARGGTVIENGDDGQEFTTGAWIAPAEKTPEPEIMAELLDFQSVQIFAEGEGEVHLYVNGEEMENPCVYFSGFDGGCITIMATAKGDGKLISDEAYMEFEFPVAPDPLFEVTTYNTADSTIIKIVTDAIECTLSINDTIRSLTIEQQGEPVTLTYAIPRTNQDQIFDVAIHVFSPYGVSREEYMRLLVPALGSINDFEQDGIYYKIIADDKVAVNFRDLEFNSYSGDITIPEEVTHDGITYHVVAIRASAFRDCMYLTSVEMPSTITAIGKDAFYFCPRISQITIPTAMTSIGEHAFSDCSSLKRVDITDLAAWCSISFADVESNPLRYAHHLYLNDEEITQLDLPAGIRTISQYAFYYASYFTSVTIPSTVDSIGNNAFAACSKMTRVNISDLRSWCGITFANLSANPLSCAHHLYLNDVEVTALELPSGLETIKGYAFASGSAITTVDIPNTVSSIDQSAFYYCEGLTSVNLPDAMVSIGNSAFYNCNQLSSINIPNSVVSIGPSAFWNCKALTSMNLPKTLSSLGSSAFANCTGLTSINIPESLEEIATRAFSGCKGLTNITIGKSVQRIEDYAFYNCKGLKSVVLPASVNYIDYCAFDNCIALNTFTCLATTPPTASYGLVHSSCYNATTLIVPEASVAAYQAAKYWKNFSHVEGLAGAGSGDVNGDGEIGVNDVTDFIDTLLSGNGDTLSPYADVNGDGVISIADIAALIDMLLSGN